MKCRSSRLPLVSLLSALAGLAGPAVLATSETTAFAQPAASAFSLEVDSDAPDVLSYEILAPRLAQDLGGTVGTAGGAPPQKATIAIRYRDRTLTVRTVHTGDRVLERSIKPEGDATAVRAEAVLLAGNLARDEARELIDELASRNLRSPQPPPPSVPETPSATPAKDAVPETHAPATVAIFYPLATNANDPDVASPFNFSLVYGRIARSEAFDMAPLGVAHATRSVSGAQLGTAAAISGGTLSGVQLSIATAFAVEHATGAQLSTGLNYAGAGMGGLQMAAGANVAARRAGTPRAAVPESEHFRGAQLSAGANIVTTPGHGFMGTSGVNLTTERFEGAQLAIINVGADVSGGQLGIVNIGKKVKGLQLGVVNIAEEVDGVALGIASIAKDSIHPLLWGGNLAYTNAGIKFTTKYVYTLIAIGNGTRELGFDDRVVVTTGLGGHVPLPGNFDLDIEAAHSNVASASKEYQALHIRALPGYRFAKHLRVFAGGGPRIPLLFEKESYAVRPEVLAGVQF